MNVYPRVVDVAGAAAAAVDAVGSTVVVAAAAAAAAAVEGVADYCCTLADRPEWTVGRSARCRTVPSCNRSCLPAAAAVAVTVGRAQVTAIVAFCSVLSWRLAVRGSYCLASGDLWQREVKLRN